MQETAIRFLDKQLDALRGIVREFPADRLWIRPADGTASLGNLCHHVAGSMRDWFENGLAQGAWSRDRPREFHRGDEDGGATELIEALDDARNHCAALFDQVAADDWQALRSFRDKTYTVEEIFWHQVEHVAYHVGQAAFLRRLVADLPPRP